MGRAHLVEWTLTTIVVVGLAVDAYLHLRLAPDYALVRTRLLSQADLFRLEAALAVVSAVWLAVRRSVPAAAVACVVAGGGAFAILLYRYVDPGVIGPLPDMFEPVWFAAKQQALAAEVVAALAALGIVARLVVRRPVAGGSDDGRSPRNLR